MNNLTITNNNIRRGSLLILGVLVLVNLTACSDDRIVGTGAPSSGAEMGFSSTRQFDRTPETELADGDFALDRRDIDSGSLAARRAGRRTMRVINSPGSGAQFVHMGKAGRVLAPYLSLQEAVVSLDDFPLRRLGAKVDFNRYDGFMELAQDLILQRSAFLAAQPYTREVIQRARLDLSLLTDKQQVWYNDIWLPYSRGVEDLEAVNDHLTDLAAAGEKGLFKLVEALFDALAGEDNRFGDHDGDGVPNVNDRDFEGTIWSTASGSMSSSREGGVTTVTIKGCIPDCCPGSPVQCGG